MDDMGASSRNYHLHSHSPSCSISRSWSPGYSRSQPNNSYNRYHRSSPYYSSYRRRSPRSDETPQSDGRNRNRYDDRKKSFLVRDYKNGRHGESESDEQLRSFGFEEYMRPKCQKLRKLLKKCMWNSTPNLPRDPNQSSYFEPEDEITRKVEEEKERHKLKSGLKKLSSDSLESESESVPEDFESRSDDLLSRKKRKSRKLS